MLSKQIKHTALGKLKVEMKNGFKSTETAWCSRNEMQKTLRQILSINGHKVEIVNLYWNNKKIAA